MKKDELMKSLNDEIMTEFQVNQLEERLETDPLMIGNALDASIPLETDCFTCSLCFCFSCGEFSL